MNTQQITDTFFEFFVDRGHHSIDGNTLITRPGDPVLFTTSGMHPLTPYLDGRTHPHGPRLVNLQRCLRTTDLDEVGDNTHLTVFEMLGSWSLGDYSHQQSLRWGYELLRDGFGIPPKRLHVTVFGGEGNLGPDVESERVWQELCVPVEFLGDDNWWPNTTTPGHCGPDSEIFYWTGDGPPTGTPSRDPRWIEIWNHVSMRYRRHDDGTLTPLPQSNVDTGMGLERTVTVLQGQDSVYGTDLLRPWIDSIGRLWGLPETALRIVVDHLRSSIVVIGDGVHPSNTGRGYVLRRLVRRSLTQLWTGDLTRTLNDLPPELIEQTISHFQLPIGPGEVLQDEERRFRRLLDRGRQQVSRQLSRTGTLTEQDYHLLHDTHGLPRELVDGILSGL